MKAALSGKADDQGNSKGPSASEIAERIKALKASHTVEAGPQRAYERSVSTATPVTSIIKRLADPVAQAIEQAKPMELDQRTVVRAASFTDRIDRQRALQETGAWTLGA